MTTLTLKIEANEQSAAVYRNANQTEKQRMKALFQTFFEKIVLHDNARSAMYQALDPKRCFRPKYGFSHFILRGSLFSAFTLKVSETPSFTPHFSTFSPTFAPHFKECGKKLLSNSVVRLK